MTGEVDNEGQAETGGRRRKSEWPWIDVRRRGAASEVKRSDTKPILAGGTGLR